MGSYLLFSISARIYAIPLESVEEVVKVDRYTEIPGMPIFVRGFFNLRGNIYTMIELDELIVKENIDADFNHIIVLKTPNQEVDKVAIVAETIRNVVELEPENFKNVPEAEDEAFKKFIEFMYVDSKESFNVLNVENILDLKEGLDDK